MKLFGGKQRGGGSVGTGPLRRRLVPVLLAVLAALAALAGGLALLLHSLASSDPQKQSLHPAVDPKRVIATPPPTEPPPEDAPEDAGVKAQPERVGDRVSFVILGCGSGGLSAETVIAGRFDPETGGIEAASLPRDTLVDVEWGVKKLNTILRFGEGTEDVLELMGGLLGFRPDYYIFLDASAAETLLDAAGGVYYNVERDFDYDDPIQDLHIHVPAGERLLSGTEAAGLLRFLMGNDGTGYPDGDLGRIRTQQKLLSALLAQWHASGEIPNAGTLREKFFELAETNLTPDELSAYAAAFLRGAEPEARFSLAPGEAVCIRGGYYYQLDPNPWIERINASLNPWSVPVEPAGLDILLRFGEDGAVSTHGVVVPLESFFDYDAYYTHER